MDPADGGPPADPADAAGPPAGAAEAAGPLQPDERGAVDLEAVAAELADVERAMERIEAGTYWTDEVTGAALPDELLAEHPTARRAATAPVTDP
jgi:RNA polymerase-binding transcription factor DksA